MTDSVLCASITEIKIILEQQIGAILPSLFKESLFNLIINIL